MDSQQYQNLKVVVLAGGVGGSKMAHGLAQILPPENLFIIGNTADDFEHMGLYISPDIDTLMYTLGKVNNPETGWGRADETWHTLEALQLLNGPTWFSVGDKDLATHLLRTHWLREGYPLSWVTAQLCRRFRVKPTLMPMTDSPVQTIFDTNEGKLPFQEYFVRWRAEPRVNHIEFVGAESAQNNRDILNAIRLADLIVFAPSNPLLSLDPILSLPSMRRLLAASQTTKIGISPIIGGKTVRGPAAKIMHELGIEASAFGVASHLKDVLSHFMIDTVDQVHRGRISNLGLNILTTDILMRSPADQARLAREVLDFVLR